MSTASETQLGTALKQGIANLGRDQFIVFTQYTKVVLSQDGYVFWVATANTLKAPGILHYDTDREQDDDQTIGVNTIQFTSEVEITELNAIGTGTMWLAEWNTPEGVIQIAFSSRTSYFEQSGLFHYVGIAVYPALQSQIVASSSDLPIGPIVSNSLPIWLALPTSLVGLPGVTAPKITVYPSFLVPENIVPPYIVAHIEPQDTKAIQSFMRYEWSQKTGSGPYQLPSSQLVEDTVRFSLYGLTNQQALQWLSALTKYSEYTDAFGFMNSPVFQDEKRTQPEIASIAMKKTLTLRASYYQSTSDAIARQLITSAAMTVN